MIESHFEDIDSVISDLILKSKKSIEIATAWLTHLELIKLLQSQASLHSTKIRIIISDDEVNFKFLNYYQFLVESGVEFYIHERKDRFNLMHNKFAIFDSQIVTTGSFNWTNSAQSNLENIIISREDREMAKKFSLEFERIFGVSKKLENFSSQDTSEIKENKRLDDEMLWSFLSYFHIAEFNPTPQRLWRVMKGTKSKTIKEKTSWMPFYDTIEDFPSAKYVLEEIEDFFEKNKNLLNKEFQYEERGWNKIDFPGKNIYCLFSSDFLQKLKEVELSNKKYGKKWSNQELAMLRNYLRNTNDPAILSKLINRNENSIIYKSRRLLYSDPTLFEEWKKKQQ